MKYPKLRELKEAITAMIKKPYTSDFPAKPHHPAKRFRGKPEYSNEGCIACTACEQSCPTGTIEYHDQGRQRIFSYSHYQCICCAACVKTCPENAAELRHELSLKRFFQILGKHVIRTAEMQACEQCGALFAPEPQMQKVAKIFTHHDYLRFCQNCRKTNIGTVYQRLNPWHRAGAGEKKADAPVKHQA